MFPIAHFMTNPDFPEPTLHQESGIEGNYRMEASGH